MCYEWSIEFLKSCIENVYTVDENFRELTPDEILEIETY